MESAYILLVLVALFIVFVMPVWAMILASSAKKRAEQLGLELEELRSRLARMEQGRPEPQDAPESGRAAARSAILPRRGMPPVSAVTGPEVAFRVEVEPASADTDFVRADPPVSPLVPVFFPGQVHSLLKPVEVPVPIPDRVAAQTVGKAPRYATTPPPLTVPASATPLADEETKPPLSLEQFMGAKLFAWIGGLALFFGVILFVKLSIERGWISPELRTGIGFVTGVALVGAGWLTQRRKTYAVLAHTLCATGVVVLYGVTFAAHALYQIPPLDRPMAAFAMMSIITAGAFWLSVRLHAQVITVLGMLGGFLTPILCSTGQDNPFGLFSYIALLDVGVLAVAQRKRWGHLTPLAALGTMVMQLGWWGTFFRTSGYAMGAATWIPVGVFLGFALLFSIAAARKQEDDPDELFVVGSACAILAGAMLAAFVFLAYPGITARPLVLYGFVGGITLIAMGLAWFRPNALVAVRSIAGLTLLHLAFWTTFHLTPPFLSTALGTYLAFGVLHTAFAIVWQRKHGAGGGSAGWMPLASLLLMLLPVVGLDMGGSMVWIMVLVVNVLVITLAFRSGGLGPVLAALLMTLLAAGSWLYGGPLVPEIAAGQLPSFLLVLAGFALLFGGTGASLAKKFPTHQCAALLPVSSAILPFPLLGLVIARLAQPDPAPVFGVAALLAVFLLGMARFGGVPLLSAVALGGITVLEWLWHFRNFTSSSVGTPLSWYLGFYALFTVFPFVFRRHFATERMPWIVAAAAGLGAFGMVYKAIGWMWPANIMGLLPAAFAIAPLAGLFYIAKKHDLENPARLSQMAWFGGTALFFLTLIIPIQFEKQWITLGWALEGAALCWLFRRVPHPGLRGTGAVLLTTAFVRLALNPAVLTYQISTGVVLLNWQLYTYGLAAASLFVAAALLAPPRHLWGEVNLRAVFSAMGGILLFLLLNIQIADAFTPAGSPSLVFDFDGNFARDMTYTISWALFALGLMVLGVWKRHAAPRYAGIVLLTVALIKLFLRDLDSIGSGYRIGAFLAVAIIALAASWLYQRFLREV